MSQHFSRVTQQVGARFQTSTRSVPYPVRRDLPLERAFADRCHVNTSLPLVRVEWSTEMEERGAPNRQLVEFVYSNLMLNSISLAARNVRFLLTCLWIYLPGATLSNLRYVCCLFLTKKSTFWATCCGLGERFRLA